MLLYFLIVFLFKKKQSNDRYWTKLFRNANFQNRMIEYFVDRIDVRVIIAPAVVLKPSKIICGAAFELTCLKDIDVAINSDQMQLLWHIYLEINNLFSNFSDTLDSPSDPNNLTLSIVRGSQDVPTPILKEHEPDFTGDSGVDFESSSVNYVPTVRNNFFFLNNFYHFFHANIFS